jgi:hypothetical protein
MITRQNTLQHEPGRYSAEASDLRWPVGRWPRYPATTLGNGCPFIIFRVEEDEIGGVRWVDYIQDRGCLRLRVFND